MGLGRDAMSRVSARVIVDLKSLKGFKMFEMFQFLCYRITIIIQSPFNSNSIIDAKIPIYISFFLLTFLHYLVSGITPFR